MTGLRSEDDFVDDGFGFPWVFFEVGSSISETAWLTGAETSALPSLVLVWPWNCGSAT